MFCGAQLHGDCSAEYFSTPEGLAIASCKESGEDIAQYWVRPDASHPNNNSVHMQMTNKGTHCCPQHTAWVVSPGKDGSTLGDVMCLYLPPYQTTSRHSMLALKQPTHSLL